MWTEWFAKAREQERKLILGIMKEVAMSNDIGDYCYIDDVISYLKEADAKARR